MLVTVKPYFWLRRRKCFKWRKGIAVVTVLFVQRKSCDAVIKLLWYRILGGRNCYSALLANEAARA